MKANLYRGYKRNSDVIEYCYVFGCKNNSKAFFLKKKKKLAQCKNFKKIFHP